MHHKSRSRVNAIVLIEAVSRYNSPTFRGDHSTDGRWAQLEEARQCLDDEGQTARWRCHDRLTGVSVNSTAQCYEHVKDGRPQHFNIN